MWPQLVGLVTCLVLRSGWYSILLSSSDYLYCIPTQKSCESFESNGHLKHFENVLNIRLFSELPEIGVIDIVAAMAPAGGQASADHLATAVPTAHLHQVLGMKRPMAD